MQDHKNNNDYRLITSEHLKNGCLLHYPVVLGISFNNIELEEKVKEYGKNNLSLQILENDKKLEQKLLRVVINAALKENKCIGYRFVDTVNGTYQKFNAINVTIQVD